MECKRGWVSPSACLDDMEKLKFFTLPGFKLHTLSHPARSQSLYRLHYLESQLDNKLNKKHNMLTHAFLKLWNGNIQYLQHKGQIRCLDKQENRTKSRKLREPALMERGQTCKWKEWRMSKIISKWKKPPWKSFIKSKHVNQDSHCTSVNLWGMWNTFCPAPIVNKLWSSGQSSWLEIQGSRYDSQRYQIFWEVVGLEQGPLSLISKTEELLGKKKKQQLRSRKPRLWP
jgi:hypothetical protein